MNIFELASLLRRGGKEAKIDSFSGGIMRINAWMIVAFLIACNLAGREIFVSPEGNDLNSGVRNAPLATVTAAAGRADAGDVVRILPGIYRENVVFKKSGTAALPITFTGIRGRNGEYLTIIEAPGERLTHWSPAPEVAPGVWKAKVAKRPDLVMMDGRMISFINSRTMALPRWKSVPSGMDEAMFWSAPGENCRRLPGFDLLSLPQETLVRHQYFGKRKESFWEVLSFVLAGWDKGYLYLRLAQDGDRPQKHEITVSYGDCLVLRNASHLIFHDLHVRGSARQFRLTGKSSHNTIENCLLMHGGIRINIASSVTHTTVKNSFLTAGFIRNDLFKLRSSADMRGGLLYLIFKYIIGFASSNDCGILDKGNKTLISNNIIVQGLIGIDAWGSECTVKDNVVREMASVGICTGAASSGRFHDNLVMNCGIPLRIHDLRGARARREEFHYRNLFVQAPHGGSQIYVHCESHRWGPDTVNFVKGTNRYLAEPPEPVDAGKIWIYHNTFWGGDDFVPGFTVRYLARRFRMTMPFVFINNVMKDSRRLDTFSQTLLDKNLFYNFIPEAERRAKPLDAALAERNKVVDMSVTQKLWKRADLPGLPDVTLAADSPARECGVDVSGSFTVNGKNFPALPGFVPGYFPGKVPDAGALQYGESMQNFIRKHKLTEALIKKFCQVR